MNTRLQHPHMERVNTWLYMLRQQVGYAGNTHCLTTVEELKGKDVSSAYEWFGVFVENVSQSISNYKYLLDGDFMLARGLTDTILEAMNDRMVIASGRGSVGDYKVVQHKFDLLLAIFDCKLEDWIKRNRTLQLSNETVKEMDNFVFGSVINKINQLNKERER